MPIYEYECAGCSNKFEQLLSLSSPKPDCPKCHGKKVEKLFSAFGCKAGGSITSSVKGQGCGGCSSHNCGRCH
ncbi:MAG: zinc ribbon domain-containing protein [Candidatus Edwardsbacteria bacterium]|nr:zinc ribbon domain-containing protein [Candidatus Edwardsbacteria bacterium]